MMTSFARRALVKAGTALTAAGTLTGPALLEWAKAWAQASPWRPEKDAQLALLRWRYFVRAEEDAFLAIMDAFKKVTGVRITVSHESNVIE
jgi:multiple sugar transport system substrate-binding protein